jgi:hypothetical protein
MKKWLRHSSAWQASPSSSVAVTRHRPTITRPAIMIDEIWLSLGSVEVSERCAPGKDDRGSLAAVFRLPFLPKHGVSSSHASKRDGSGK